MKKDTVNWCDFHKSPWHKNVDFCSKKSLVTEVKAYELYAGSNSKSKPKNKRHIIDAEPNATVATTKIHPSEPDELEEGEPLFHSHMQVMGTQIHFIIDRSSQKNLISSEVFKWLNLLTTPHSQPYTIRWLCQGSDLCISQQCCCPMASSPSKMRYFVMSILLKFVVFFWANLIYGNVILYMSLDLAVLLLLRT
jgi:hypothetical protein